jgi:hypothetical protein
MPAPGFDIHPVRTKSGISWHSAKAIAKTCGVRDWAEISGAAGWICPGKRPAPYFDGAACTAVPADARSYSALNSQPIKATTAFGKPDGHPRKQHPARGQCIEARSFGSQRRHKTHRDGAASRRTTRVRRT